MTAPAAARVFYVVTFDLRSWDRTVEASATRAEAEETVIDFAVEHCDAAEGCSLDDAIEAINQSGHAAWIDEVAVSS